MKEKIEDIKAIMGLKTVSEDKKAIMIAEMIEEPKRKVFEKPEVAEEVQKPKRQRRNKREAVFGRRRLSQEEINQITTTLKSAKDLNKERKIKMISNLVNRTHKAVKNFFLRVTKDDPVLTKKYDLSELKKVLEYKPQEIEVPIKRKGRRKKYSGLLQTEIDTCYKEWKMGTSYNKIAKLLDTNVNRVRYILGRIKEGKAIPSTKKKDSTVEVGHGTKMPRKFNYQG